MISVFLFWGCLGSKQTPSFVKSEKTNSNSGQDSRQGCLLALSSAQQMFPNKSWRSVEQKNLDLNGDGIFDCILSHRESSKNASVLLYLSTDMEPTYVGTVDANILFGGLDCLDESVHGLCTISASILMIHGETQISTYLFDGEKYLRKSTITSQHPHPKFGP